MGNFLCLEKLNNCRISCGKKNRIPIIYHMTYFIVDLLIYFDLNRGKFSLVFIKILKAPLMCVCLTTLRGFAIYVMAGLVKGNKFALL